MKDVHEHLCGKPRHADYPHHPGMLYDCPACEAECFCEEFPPFKCVRCEGGA